MDQIGRNSRTQQRTRIDPDLIWYTKNCTEKLMVGVHQKILNYDNSKRKKEHKLEKLNELKNEWKTK